MKRYKTIVTVFVLVGLLVVVLGVQAESENRYLIKSDKAFWKNTFNSRHVFDDGFTANLSNWQLKLAKVFNVDVEPIPMLQILPTDAGILQGPELGAPLGMPEVSAPKKDRPVKPDKPDKPGKPDDPVDTDGTVPEDQTPWGIEVIYNDADIEETSGGKDVTVAVLDTGVNKDHADLARRVTKCGDFTDPDIVFYEGECSDLNGHGTHVAGIIGADGGEDGLGIYGVAPEVSIWAYKVCDVSGSCWADDIAGAIRQAADLSVNIINLSIGSDVEIPMITDAINYAREVREGKEAVLVIVAAGNDGPSKASIDHPAAHEYAVSVGAFDENYNIARWSSRGINSGTIEYEKNAGDIEFAAPGVEIESTWKDDGYAKKSGTSMATPFIAGLAAKLWGGTADTTRTALQLLANDIGKIGDDDASGFGFPVVPDATYKVN